MWDALNFGLSKYYNNKKYLEGITQQLQYVFWKGAVVLLQTIGFSVSAELLNHAISEKPSNLMIDNGFIIESIKKDEANVSCKEKIIAGSKTLHETLESPINVNGYNVDDEFAKGWYLRMSNKLSVVWHYDWFKKYILKK